MDTAVYVCVCVVGGGAAGGGQLTQWNIVIAKDIAYHLVKL